TYLLVSARTNRRCRIHIHCKCVVSHDTINITGNLCGDDLIANVISNQFGGPMLWITPASATTAVKNKRLASLEWNSAKHLRKPIAFFVHPTDGLQLAVRKTTLLLLMSS